MRNFLITSIVIFNVFSGNAQTQKDFFNTLGKSKKKITITISTQKDSIQKPTIYVDSIDAPEAIATNPPLKTQEELIEEIEQYLAKRYKRVINKNGKPAKIWRLYEKRGSLPFNLSNLVAVMKEEGIKEPLVVLAQSLLETGYFTSNVFRKYNNLFGLYDSRSKDYYHFLRWEDSVTGYIKFIQYRYRGGNYLEWLRKIGYADDYSYIQKVRQIMKKLKRT